MVKKIRGEVILKQTQRVPQNQECQYKKQCICVDSDQKYIQFFQFLKELQNSESKQESHPPQFQCRIRSMTTSLMQFFNHQKSYSKLELDSYTICLANLFNILGEDISQLKFQREFRIKLRRFAADLVEEQSQINYQSKTQALLYILVVLIYKERISEINTIKELNRSLYADRILLVSLLQLSLPKNKKISKFYGIVMIYLSNKKNSKRIKEQLVRSIFKNINKIEHEPTLFNLIVYLRREKNKLKINLLDLMEGKVFQLLVQSYPKNIHQYQSYYILDYLLHLLILFPLLAHKIAGTNFIPYLLEMTYPTNLHHPLHESAIIEFVKCGLKYLQPCAKRQLMDAIISVNSPDNYISIKLAQIVIDFQGLHGQLQILVQRGYFQTLLKMITVRTELDIIKKAANLYCMVMKRMIIFNKSIGSYLCFKLKLRMKEIPIQEIEQIIHQTELNLDSL